ncbi:MAG: hypothetical protein RSB38_07890 [Oscillospiraceae bacterium]
MQGLLFPIIMLTVTLVGGGLLLLVLKNAKPKHTTNEDTIAMQTAQILPFRLLWASSPRMRTSPAQS